MFCCFGPSSAVLSSPTQLAQVQNFFEQESTEFERWHSIQRSGRCKRLSFSQFLPGNSLSQEQIRVLSTITYLEELRLNRVRFEVDHFNLLFKLKGLQRLSMSGCDLLTFPYHIQFQNLIALDLSKNQIEDSSMAGIGRYTQLIYLNLSNNNLTAQGLEELRPLHNLTVLDVSYNKIQFQAFHDLACWSSLKELKIYKNLPGNLNALTSLPKLTDLDASGMNLDNSQIRSLTSCNELRSLDLSRNRITEDGISEFVKLKKLRNLNLSFNRIAFLTQGSVADLLNLRELNLKYNTLSTFSLLSIPTNLTALDLSNTKLQDYSFLRAENVRQLCLVRNNIHDTELSSLIPHIQRIEVLDLSGNQIGEKGIQLLSTLKSLTDLNVANNHLRDLAMQHIYKLEKLHFLHMENNYISGLYLLNLTKMKKLRKVYLKGNPIHQQDANLLHAAHKMEVIF